MNDRTPPGRDPHAVLHPGPDGAPRLTDERHVVVVGGGIAGIAAAVVLAERGARVTLVEACEQLGGRVRAWPTQDGRTMSRGFHAFFRQYYTLRALLRRVDPELDHLVPVPDYPLRRGDGLTDSFAKLPATPPANLVTFVLRSPTFPVSALPSVHIPSALELVNVSYPESHERYDGESAQDFLDRLRFPDGARHLALEVFARSFFARPPERVRRRGAGRDVPHLLHRLLRGPALRRAGRRLRHRPVGAAGALPVRARGADPHRRAAGEQVAPPSGYAAQPAGPDGTADGGDDGGDDGGAWTVRTDAGELTADAVVLATDPRATRALVADLPVSQDRTLGRAQRSWHERLAAGRNAPPFVVLRLWCDGLVAPSREAFLGTSGYDLLDNVTVLERFEQGAADWSAEHGGSVVELHGYAVDPHRDPDVAGGGRGGLDEERVRARLLASLHQVYPETAELESVHEELVVEDDCGLVGTGPWRQRPTVDTPYPGLALAGDGLRVDWPIALMERAAVTGVLAANHLLQGWGVRGEDVWTVPLEGILRRRPHLPAAVRDGAATVPGLLRDGATRVPAALRRGAARVPGLRGR
ncbi:FAD-dependent oxidoreductase [Ornithinimicrobium sp. W1665]|uniref:FAD-dependent oxidoreductase n=1 Tax=Ornithinimicrobium sp. W1665 TaxID=3416666 RepID=UPI003D6BE2B5